MTGWHQIHAPEKAPGHGRIILLFAVTDRDGEGNVKNWKMATGNWSKYNGWTWDGRQLAAWDYIPTHWQPMPKPPND